MRHTISTLATLALISFAALTIPSSGRADGDDDALLIIANNGVKESTITASEVKQIFLKQRASWRSGGKVTPINAKPGSPERAAFLKKVLGMNASEETSYWQDQKIKKGLTPPPEFANTPKAVFSLKGSIGYCLKSAYRPGTVKVLLTL